MCDGNVCDNGILTEKALELINDKNKMTEKVLANSNDIKLIQTIK